MSTSTTEPRRTPVRAALASFMGSAVEYYDFFIFGSAAALIFPHVFFPDADTNALVMSFATFGFAYIARPIGAIILGHFGDRIGRQKVLMFTLVLMGLSTFLIGCLPDFTTIGWLAPILLVLARLMQGLSAAGEQAGASSLSLEHAPDNRRAFFTSWTLTGTQGGQILAALVFIPVVAMPDEFKYGIGWRIPFWLSAVVVLVAFFIRRSLHESPDFEAAKQSGEIAKLPVAALLRYHWRDVLLVVLCATIAAVSTVFGNLAIARDSTTPRRSGSSSSRTSSRSARSPCSAPSPTASAASPCLSMVPSRVRCSCPSTCSRCGKMRSGSPS